MFYFFKYKKSPYPECICHNFPQGVLTTTFLFSTWTQKASTDNGGQREKYTVNLVVHKGILMKLNGDVHQFMCTLLNTTTASFFPSKEVL